jgi:predicted nucleic-acid-binding protein
MIGLDTNILIRFVAQDDPVNSPIANAIIESLTAEEPGWIAVTAIAEFSWVLSRTYRMNRADLHSILHQLLARPEIIIEHADLIRKASSLYLRGNADFTDYLIACAGQAAGCKQTLTFDRKAARSAGMTLASRSRT